MYIGIEAGDKVGVITNGEIIIGHQPKTGPTLQGESQGLTVR
jgi:hypothetical protein